jgi:hypothetical protein
VLKSRVDSRQLALNLPDFDGATYSREQDHERLGRQLYRVLTVMRDGHWRTLSEIELLVAAPQASISARLRDLRKLKFGGWLVDRRPRHEWKDGLFEYRLVRAGKGVS